MIDEILSTYKTFSDSTIVKVEYCQKERDNFNAKMCNVHLKSYNWHKDIFENIVLIFNNVIFFSFREIQNVSSLNITDALLKYEDSTITLDFFPHQFPDGVLEVDMASDFLIKAQKLELKIDNS